MIHHLSPTYVLINIIGGVALMIWSLKLIRLGATRGFGAGLNRALAISTRNRILALLVGAFVTTLLQSSMATIMIVASFAGQAMIGTSSALALVLGADVGTTLVAQLLTFDLSLIAPVCIIAGVFMFGREGRLKNVGRILIGLGLILVSLRWISESAIPIKSSETLPLVLSPLQDDNILALFVASAMTWLMHSSLASVLLLMSLVSNGVLPIKLGLVMVLGVNLGGTIAPLVSTFRDAPAATRIPAGNMLMRVVGVFAVLPFLDTLEPLLASFSGETGRQLVNFHMAFNIGMALAFMPLTGVVADVCTRFIPDRHNPDDPSKPRYLSEKEIDTPAIALASASRETLRMADVLQAMLEDTIKAFKTNDEKFIHGIQDKDDIIDKLYESLKRYMARLNQEYMDKGDAQRYVQVLTFATNLEHAGDIIDKNLMPLALKKIRNQGQFSQKGFQEIELIHSRVMDSVKLAQNVFISGDLNLARKLVEDKESLRKAELEASTNHIDRLREGVPESIATTSLHLDIIRDYRRINSYVSTVAFPLLEEKGHLVSSRLHPKEA